MSSRYFKAFLPSQLPVVFHLLASASSCSDFVFFLIFSPFVFGSLDLLSCVLQLLPFLFTLSGFPHSCGSFSLEALKISTQFSCLTLSTSIFFLFLLSFRSTVAG
jgi:hypothetical protein